MAGSKWLKLLGCSLGFGGGIVGIENLRGAGVVEALNETLGGSVGTIGLVNKSAQSSWGLFGSAVGCTRGVTVGADGWTGVDEIERSNRSPVNRSTGPD